MSLRVRLPGEIVTRLKHLNREMQADEREADTTDVDDTSQPKLSPAAKPLDLAPKFDDIRAAIRSLPVRSDAVEALSRDLSGIEHSGDAERRGILRKWSLAIRE